MPRPGEILRAFRESWGWTTRQVGDKSQKLADIWGNPEYALDSSSVSRIENGDTLIPSVSSGKMTSLMEIYSRGANTLWSLIKPERHAYLVDDPLGGPDFTQLVREGRLAEKLSVILGSTYANQTIPEKTVFTSIRDSEGYGRFHPFQDRKRYAGAIVGLTDRCIYPLIGPGALLIVDRASKAIPTYDFFNELERPKFLIETHDGLFCCWCDLLDGQRMVKVVPHPMGSIPHPSLHKPMKLGPEVEIVGEIAFWGMEGPRHRQKR